MHMVDWEAMEQTVDQDEIDVVEKVGKMVSRVALEALKEGVGEDQDVVGTVHPVLNLDEEIRMLGPVRLAVEEAGGHLNSNFVPT